MVISELLENLYGIFKDRSLYGFSLIDEDLAKGTGCKCVLVTLLPYPDLHYKYNATEYYVLCMELSKEHSEKLDKIKLFLDNKRINYVRPPASPKDDGTHLAEFSYKWAAIQAGLGFIGKNDVFVHYKYAQRVRISCLLVDIDMPVFTGDMSSKCGECDLCVQACPYQFITGHTWHIDIHREELVDYKSCATKSNHSGTEPRYLCQHCALACKYPNNNS